jgi:hypothetical protein
MIYLLWQVVSSLSNPQDGGQNRKRNLRQGHYTGRMQLSLFKLWESIHRECTIHYSKMRGLYSGRMQHSFYNCSLFTYINWKGWKGKGRKYKQWRGRRCYKFYWGTGCDRCNWAFPKSCNLPDDFVRNFDEKAESLAAANLEPVCDFVAKILCSRGGIHLEGLKKINNNEKLLPNILLLYEFKLLYILKKKKFGGGVLLKRDIICYFRTCVSRS